MHLMPYLLYLLWLEGIEEHNINEEPTTSKLETYLEGIEGGKNYN